MLVPWVSAKLGPYFSPLAVSNPFLAAEKYLQRHGVRIEKTYILEDFFARKDDADVLLMSQQIGQFTSEQLMSLLGWVAAGGTLIYQPTRISNDSMESRDDVLSEVGTQLTVAQSRKRYPIPPSDVHFNQVSCSAIKSSPVSFKREASEEYLAYFSPNLRLKDTLGSDGQGSALHQVSIEKGTLVLITGLQPWRNNVIHCDDNVQLLHDLFVSKTGKQRDVLWLQGVQTRSLYAKFWEWYPHTVVTIGLLSLFWLWNRVAREHFVKNSTAESENKLEDYLLTRAAFRWKKMRNLELLNVMRDEVLGKQWRNFDTEDIGELSKKSGVEVSQIHEALSSASFSKNVNIVNAVATLNQLKGLK